MQIEPIDPVLVKIHVNELESQGYLIEINEKEIKITSKDFFEKDVVILFISRFFKGKALIKKVSYQDCLFTYLLEIHSINYQPGLLINTKL